MAYGGGDAFGAADVVIPPRAQPGIHFPNNTFPTHHTAPELGCGVTAVTREHFQHFGTTPVGIRRA